MGTRRGPGRDRGRPSLAEDDCDRPGETPSEKRRHVEASGVGPWVEAAPRPFPPRSTAADACPGTVKASRPGRSVTEVEPGCLACPRPSYKTIKGGKGVDVGARQLPAATCISPERPAPGGQAGRAPLNGRGNEAVGERAGLRPGLTASSWQPLGTWAFGREAPERRQRLARAHTLPGHLTAASPASDRSRPGRLERPAGRAAPPEGGCAPRGRGGPSGPGAPEGGTKEPPLGDAVG